MTASASTSGSPLSPAAPLAFLALVAGAVAMGASPIFVRWAADEGVGPFASAFWRTALALPALWAWVAFEARRAPAARDAPSAWAATGPVVLAGLFFAGDLFFWHLAILRTTVANATFLATTMPLWVVLGSVLVLRTAVPRATYGGLALCVLGGTLLIGQSYSFAPERLVGDLYGVATGMFFAGYFLSVSAARARGISSARITFVSTAVTTAVLLAIALVFEGRVLPTTATGWTVLVAMAMISQVAGQGLLAIALGHLPAVFSSLVIFIEAMAAAAMGWILLSEALTPLQAAGGVAILAGIWLARPRKNEPA